jgi:hypothetical protein
VGTRAEEWVVWLWGQYKAANQNNAVVKFPPCNWLWFQVSTRVVWLSKFFSEPWFHYLNIAELDNHQFWFFEKNHNQVG